jgi:hypothetical protein
MWHAWGRREKCTRFWWESPKERDHWEDQGVGGKMGSEWILGRFAWGVWIGFDCLRTGTGGGLLWVRWWTFGFLRYGVSFIYTHTHDPSQNKVLSEDRICDNILARLIAFVFFGDRWILSSPSGKPKLLLQETDSCQISSTTNPRERYWTLTARWNSSV